MLPTIEELRAMREIDIMQADREQLVDISEIQIDENKTLEERMERYLEQVHNPFLVKAGEYVIKFQYMDCDKDINDRMIEYVSKMAKIRC